MAVVVDRYVLYGEAGAALLAGAGLDRIGRWLGTAAGRERSSGCLAMAVSPVQAGTFDGRDKPFAVTGPLMLTRRRIWVVGRAPSALLAAGPMRAESEVLIRRFTLIADRHFRGIVVTLWLRR